MACRLLQPLYDQSSYVLCALAIDAARNKQQSVSAQTFTTPDGAPPVLLLTAAAPRSAQPTLTGTSSDAVFSQSGMEIRHTGSVPVALSTAGYTGAYGSWGCAGWFECRGFA